MLHIVQPRILRFLGGILAQIACGFTHSPDWLLRNYSFAAGAQLDAVDHKLPIEGSVGALKKAQEAGKIRYVVLSTDLGGGDRAGEENCADRQRPEPLHLTDRDSQDVLDYCKKEKMGFLPCAPIGGSAEALELEAKRRKYNPVQLELAWLLQKSPVMLPIPGTTNISHLEENMAAANIQLSPEE
jgi:pyridoxine 4-dehydrogenase